MTTHTWPLKHWLSGAVWVSASLAVTFLAYRTMSYDFTSSHLTYRAMHSNQSSPSQWPTDTDYSYSTALIQKSDKNTVLVFLNPHCVSTRPTVKQLPLVLEADPRAELIVVVVTPLVSTNQQTLAEGRCVKTIRAEVPDANIVYDRGGVQAWRFGVSNSGAVLVYDHQGKRVFQGGLIDQHGGGENPTALQRLVLALQERVGPSQMAPTPVFGCPLDAQACPLEMSRHVREAE